MHSTCKEMGTDMGKCTHLLSEDSVVIKSSKGNGVKMKTAHTKRVIFIGKFSIVISRLFQI